MAYVKTSNLYKVNDEAKNKLIADGKWEEVKSLRAELKGCGMTSRQALYAAVAKLDPEVLVYLKPKRPDPFGDGDDERKVSVVDEKKAAEVSRKLGGKSDAVDEAAGKMVDPDVFKGKSCSWGASFRWAYQNIRIGGVSAEEAPSAVAWNLLLDMRESAGLKNELLKNCIVVEMKRSDAQDDGVGAFDGSREYDIAKAVAEAAGGGV